VARPIRRSFGAGTALALVLVAGVAAGQGLPAGASACVGALAAADRAVEADALPGVVGDVCPDFLDALEASWWNASIPEDEAYFLERGGLESLIAAAETYTGRRTLALAPAELDAIVTGLEPFVTPPEPTIWEQLRDWFRGLFESENGERTWLGEWLESLTIPEAWERPILYVIAAIAVIAVLAILINELRLSGAFLGRQTRILRVIAGKSAIADQATPDFDAIHSAARLGDKVELLFGLIVGRLRQREPGRLSPALTHREIARTAGTLDASARNSLLDVAGAAERVTYADWQPDPDAWRSILTSGETLVAELDAEAEGRS
jgi:hypothetical protein